MAGPLTEFWMWLLGGAASALATLGLPIGKVVKANHKRSLQNQKQLQGDPDDPNAEGILQIVYETRSDLREFRREMRREHREMMDRLEDMEEG